MDYFAKEMQYFGRGYTILKEESLFCIGIQNISNPLAKFCIPTHFLGYALFRATPVSLLYPLKILELHKKTTLSCSNGKSKLGYLYKK